MTTKDIKLKFISQLCDRDIWIRKVSDDQYVTRCPFCGDSSNPTHGHFYVKLNLNSNQNIVYNCFKCPAGGVVTKEVCRRLDVDDSSMLSDIEVLNSKAEKYDKKDIMGVKIQYFDFKPPIVSYNDKIKYIENRLGYHFNNDELEKIKVVPSLLDFVKENNIKKLPCSKYIAELLEANYVGFMSYGNSHILFRDVTEKQHYPWIKFPITERSRENRSFYSVASTIDVFTDDLITINLCEGVMDAISICFNLEQDKPNTLTIAVAGKFYEPIITHLISLGLFGDNVVINIYADNDKDFNKKNKVEQSSIDFYKKMFRNMKYLFKQVKVIYNLKSKDCGVSRENIVLKEYKI